MISIHIGNVVYEVDPGAVVQGRGVGSMAIIGPSTLTYLYGSASVCAQRLNLRARRRSSAFREVLPVTTRTSPPGAYEYQIGTVSGPRPSSVILMIPTCRSARKLSRSCFVIAVDKAPSPYNVRVRRIGVLSIDSGDVMLPCGEPCASRPSGGLCAKQRRWRRSGVRGSPSARHRSAAIPRRCTAQIPCACPCASIRLRAVGELAPSCSLARPPRWQEPERPGVVDSPG